MYLLFVYILFVSFFFPLIFGRFLNRLIVGVFTSFCIFLSFVFCVYFFFEVGFNQSACELILFDWIHIDNLCLRFCFLYDAITSTMLVIITFISFLVHVYSIEYMKEDPHQIRFFSYISLFTFFMVILVTAGNLVQLFIGWEGVGIVSYLLINFWYSRLDANKSSIMAIFLNKIGDISLLISSSLLFVVYCSLDFSVLFGVHSFDVLLTDGNIFWIQFVGFFLVLAAIAKSAQLGLHLWLPEAMEGPTPVSSLIHAATMVTAGIFLLVRCSFLFDQLSNVCMWIILIGSLTTFFGSSIGVFQYDIKKIIAYSTCSQLGYMFLACGLLGYQNSMFHLVNHAFFKALLFLSAGAIIHCVSHEQDYRKMGGFLFFFPFSYICVLLGSFSLMGFPFLSGFYSKEGILHLFLNFFAESLDFFFYWLFFCFFFSYISIILTLVYSAKLLFYVFFQSYNGFFFYLKNIQYESLFMIFPLFCLVYLTIFSGYFTYDVFVGNGTDFWRNSLYVPLFNVEMNSLVREMSIVDKSFVYVLNYEFFDYMKDLPLFWVFYFLFVIVIMYSFFFSRVYLFDLIFSSFWIVNIFHSVNKKWVWIEKMFISFFIDICFFFGRSIYFFVEKGFVENVGSYGLSSIIQSFVYYYSFSVKGLIYHYFGFLLVGLFLLLHLVFQG